MVADTYRQQQLEGALRECEVRGTPLSWREYLRQQRRKGRSSEQIAQVISIGLGVGVSGKTVRLWLRQMEAEGRGAPGSAAWRNGGIVQLTGV